MAEKKPIVLNSSDGCLEELQAGDIFSESPSLKLVKITSTPHTIGADDGDLFWVMLDTIGANAEVTLPAAADRYDSGSGRTKPITIVNVQTGNKKTNVIADTGEDVMGDTSIELKAIDAYTLASDGTEWWWY